MFWPDGIWHAQAGVVANRTPDEKEATRIRAKELFTANAPEALKLALGPQGELLARCRRAPEAEISTI